MTHRIVSVSMRSLWVLLAVAAFVSRAADAWCHQDHRKKPAASESAREEEGPPRQEDALPTPSLSRPPGAERPAPQSFRILWRQELFAHMHNKIVHFPIALGLMGAVLVLLSLWRSEYESAARLLVLFAAVSALGAYFAGQAQADPFEGSELEAVLEWHERLGITTTILLWLGVVVSWSPPSIRRWRWAWALLVLAVIPVTGFFGGILAHAG